MLPIEKKKNLVIVSLLILFPYVLYDPLVAMLSFVQMGQLAWNHLFFSF